MSQRRLTIATRGSRLALWQAEHVRDQLIAAEDGALEVELLVVKTKGDKILDVPLAKVGGKGLFVKEIEEALMDSRADLAVHSMKDVPAELAPGLTMAAISAREDPSDALVLAPGMVGGLAGLAQGARVGTSSLRRQSQLLAQREDLEIIPLRGNVPTRLRKLDEGNYDAIVLASAGLIRLGFGDRISERLVTSSFVPAAGQGALGIEVRASDREVAALVERACGDPINSTRVLAERAFLARLGGGCQVPLAAHAVRVDDQLHIDGLVASVDGKTVIRASRSGSANEATRLGVELAELLIDRGADEILAALTAST